jgi:hypothetical protein
MTIDELIKEIKSLSKEDETRLFNRLEEKNKKIEE